MSTLFDFCDKIASDIPPSTDQAQLTELAREAEAHLESVDAVLDALHSSMVAAEGDRLLAYWAFVDKLCKTNAAFVEVIRPKLASLLSRCTIPASSPQWPHFRQLLQSLQVLMANPAISGLISIIVQRAESSTNTSGGVEKGSSNTGTADGSNRTSTALVQQTAALRRVGGFSAQRNIHQRPEGTKHALQVKTRDSLVAMKTSSAYTPAVPVEITLPRPTKDVDAPEGHMQALPADHVETYLEERRKKWRDNKRRREEEEEEKEEKEKEGKGENGSTTKKDGETTTQFDDFSDIKMPLELPRDEFGVKIGNFPQGVRFLRDVIRACGGALELEVLEQRVGSMAEREVVREFGNLREFLHIHKPTFRVTKEKEKWIVRLVDDPAPDPSLPVFSWEELQCPGCTRLVKGRNFPRHYNSRKCVGIQISNGFKSKVGTPIANLAFAANCILETDLEDIDDDDVTWFRDCIESAGNERRFRLSSTRHFSRILKAIRKVRDLWLHRNNLPFTSSVFEPKLTYESTSIASFFDTVGKNIRRLPIAWIETGDVIDMCKRFCSGPLKQPFRPPPRPADPRIRMRNEYNSFLFCESELESDDQISESDDAFSDDEGEAFVFAPPISALETILVAGFERDTRKLNHKLRTAPPLQMTKVLQANRDQSLQEMYAASMKPS